MSEKSENNNVEKAKKRLGDLISKCRGTRMSQRQLAATVGLSPSNMKYIEDGINCPTADVYSKIVSTLNPTSKKRAEMDRAYMIIRNTPPPDVCDRVLATMETKKSKKRRNTKVTVKDSTTVCWRLLPVSVAKSVHDMKMIICVY